MAFNESLAARIRDRLTNVAGLEEKKMFGGVGFLVHGNMACGVHKDHMIVRVNPDKFEDLLAEPFAKVFDITGRAMKGWILVDARGLEDDAALDFWTKHGLDFATTLPPK